MKPIEVTGFVLAGGMSSRMGTNKAMLMYKNKPLVLHAAEILQPVASKVVISAKKNIYRFTGLECWTDETDIFAPMAGIYSCLKRSSTELNIFLSCDMPLVTAGFLEELLIVAQSASLVIPVHDEHCYEPLCAVYNRNLLETIKRSISKNEFGLKKFAMESDHREFHAEHSANYTPGMFININTAADFHLLGNS
jgi:molybdopterin-guanine dinucleotide biosynthesis protein A